MKLRLPHIVPLCRQAREFLIELRKLTGRGRYVFPSARGASRPLSENGVRAALRTLGYDNETMTPHGFRATARTILDEVLGVRVDYIKHQQARAVIDANGRAYNRTTHLKGRRGMMQQWADYLDTLRGRSMPRKKTIQPEPLETFTIDEGRITVEIREGSCHIIGRGRVTRCSPAGRYRPHQPPQGRPWRHLWK